MKKKSTILILFLIISNFIKAQEASKIQNPPVIMEGLVGSRGFSYQLVADKKFQSIPRLGYYTVVNFKQIGAVQNRRLYVAGHLTYTILRGLTQKPVFRQSCGRNPAFRWFYLHLCQF
jgi:hypothetical protein